MTPLCEQPSQLAHSTSSRLSRQPAVARRRKLFVTPDGLVINEVAPRPHNCGHHTIEGGATSQFEQHLRAVLGWPLGLTDLRARPPSPERARTCEAATPPGGFEPPLALPGRPSTCTPRPRRPAASSVT